jgi:hypothetical protein
LLIWETLSSGDLKNISLLMCEDFQENPIKAPQNTFSVQIFWEISIF